MVREKWSSVGGSQGAQRCIAEQASFMVRCQKDLVIEEDIMKQEVRQIIKPVVKFKALRLVFPFNTPDIKEYCPPSFQP